MGANIRITDFVKENFKVSFLYVGKGTQEIEVKLCWRGNTIYLHNFTFEEGSPHTYFVSAGHGLDYIDELEVIFVGNDWEESHTFHGNESLSTDQYEKNQDILDSSETKNLTQDMNINLENYSWGPTNEHLRDLLIDEFLRLRTYNIHHEVNEGDIVLDVGASTGIWTYTILHRKPKHVICVEPSKAEFPHLIKNTLGHPVTHVNKAITDGNGFSDAISTYYFNHFGEGSAYVETIRFKTLVELYALDRINFLKTDCEGGEYEIFKLEHYEYLRNNVDVIVGEWHLESPNQKMQFRQFRDSFLANHSNYRVHAVDGTDIMWDLWNDHFIEYYNQVIIHIDNRNHEN